MVVRITLCIHITSQRYQQVLPFAARDHILRRDRRKAQLIGVAKIDIFDDIRAPVGTDNINVRADAAAISLIATSQIEVV